MKKIIINNNPWQTRIAITWNNRLENIYFSTPAQIVLERCFFKGVVTKVLPGIQTAFIDIGQARAGFLHISEIDHELALQSISKSLQLDEEETEFETRKTLKKKDITHIFNEGDMVLVQVSKEPIYEKGAKLTTCYTLPGRLVVLMPNIPRIGVSKKIEQQEERIRLKQIVSNYLPEGMGAIIRTPSEGATEKELHKDLRYLLREWRTIEDNFANAKQSEQIYQDLPLALQIVRDHLDDTVEAVITNDKEGQQKVYKFTKIISPEHSHKIKLFKEKVDIFTFYGIDKQIQEALEKKAKLKSGGSLIIETTEAMTVIDVNTGKFTGKSNLEETIFTTNMEAAEETVRQLKLRNIGGLIVIDFIDMRSHTNRQKLFSFFDSMLKERDKFQSVVLRISEFGIVQMTRKRSGKTLTQQLTNTCSCCNGLGVVKSERTESYEILRSIKQEFTNKKPKKIITIEVHPAIFKYLTSTEFNAILSLEKEFITHITISSNKGLATSGYKIT